MREHLFLIVVSTQRDGGDCGGGMSNTHTTPNGCAPTHTHSLVTCVNTVTRLVAMGNLCLSSKLWFIFLYIFILCAEKHCLVGDSLNCLLKVDRWAAASSSVSGSLLSRRGQWNGRPVHGLVQVPLGKFLIYRSVYVLTLPSVPELWVVTRRVRPQIQSSKMSFLWRVTGGGKEDPTSEWH